jgi:hypothetical protein
MGISKTGFFPFPLLLAIKAEFRLLKGKKKAGFSPTKFGYSGL